MPSRPTPPRLFAESAPAPDDKGGWLYAHCDGGARGNPGPAGFGAVLQDGEGRLVAELSEFLGVRTNNFAEYSGLLACLEYALEHRHARLKVVSDSELMVKQIQGKYQVKSPDLRPLYEEAKRRINRLERFEISHALRHKNKDADRLANEAMDRGMNRVSVPKPIPASTPAARPASAPTPAARTEPKPPAMLRGFTRNGTIHLLGGAILPDGIFVKVIPE
ncbi:MAG TPA: reverse transcriptase-like protein [Granulicella sp.]